MRLGADHGRRPRHHELDLRSSRARDPGRPAGLWRRGVHVRRVGNRTSVTAGGKTVSYAYTATNALASVTDWASRTTAYSYDDAGQPASVAYPNTIASSYTIDRAGRVTNLAYTRSGSALAAFGYTFNGRGSAYERSRAPRARPATPTTPWVALPGPPTRTPPRRPSATTRSATGPAAPAPAPPRPMPTTTPTSWPPPRPPARRAPTPTIRTAIARAWSFRHRPTRPRLPCRPIRPRAPPPPTR